MPRETTTEGDARPLAGRVAVVTGASQGIGRGVAAGMASAGADLVVVGRTADSLEAAAAELAALGVEALAVAGDVRDRQTAEQAVRRAVDELGRLDVVVNAAQTFTTPTTLEEIPEEWFRTNMDSGLFGTLHLMQAAFPAMRAAGGSIINFGSYAGVHSSPGYAAYAASKEAIRALSRVAARDWGRYGIRVNVINPASDSPAARRFFERDPENFQKIIDSIALGRLGDPEADIAPVAVFLAGDGARYVTGQTVNVEGGRWMF